MAGRRSEKKVRLAQPVISQPKKGRPSSCKVERPKRVVARLEAKSASGPTRTNTDDLSEKEKQYQLLNAELEAKTADIVRQAEELMRGQNEVLSRPLSTVLLTDTDDEEESRIVKSQRCTVLEPDVKVVVKKRGTSTAHSMKQGNNPHCKTVTSKTSCVEDSAAVGDSSDLFLVKTIRSMEEKMNDTVIYENVAEDEANAGDIVGSGVADAQIRVLKAKLRIMQEELDQLSCEYYKKDDENVKLSARVKELEEDRARLQRTTNVQQTQIEKHRALAEESNKKRDGLQLQVSALNKEIENLNRSQKQAVAVHGTVEVRLNRALEEVERLKTQLNKMEQISKDKVSEEHQTKENLLAENQMLKKQKAELIVGFKKQLKLIDVLKRQKMHFEAAKLLSFTEEEFLKALDWGSHKHGGSDA